MYLPRGSDPEREHSLLVVIHGQSRGAERYAELFQPVADRLGYVLLAPLFPETVRYQELGLGGEQRTDLRVLALVDEVAEALSVRARPFDLFGYSGGGQFAHRFLYVWPERLRTVVIGAPGTVTVPDPRQPWSIGVRGLARLSGNRFDLEAVRRPRVMLLVGSEDLDLEGLNQSPRAMRTGSSRLGRARSLHAAWQVAGIQHEYLEMPNVKHGLDAEIVAVAGEFLAAGR